MKIFLIVILIASAPAMFAQTKKLRWETAACSFESFYDAKKYAAAELNDTRKLLTMDFFPNRVDPTPTEYSDVKNLRVETLDAEYTERTNELKNLKIVKSAYWEARRQKQLKTLEQIYQLARASMLGYKHPARLRDVKFAGACVEKFAAPLIAGGDALLAAWKTQFKTNLSQNGRSDSAEKEFAARYGSPEKMQYARIELMAYGWWNCVNNLIDRADDTEQNEKEYRKLFIRTKTVECEQP